MTNPSQAEQDRRSAEALRCPHCGELPAGGHRLVAGKDCPALSAASCRIPGCTEPPAGTCCICDRQICHEHSAFSLTAADERFCVPSCVNTGLKRFERVELWDELEERREARERRERGES